MRSQPTRRRLLTDAGLVAALATARSPLTAALERVGRRAGQDEGWADDFDLAADVTYLNHASIGTVPRAVREAQVRLLAVCESNPWLHVWGDAWDELEQRTREKAAALLSCTTNDLAITHSTTEAFNLFAQGLPLAKGDEVLFSQLNHIGASAAWEHLAPVRGFSVRRFELPEEDLSTWSDADVVAAHLEALSDRTRVLVLPHVDNVYGLRHPVKAMAAAARARGVRWVLVDAAQTAGMLELDVPALGVDGFATSAHKWLQAPKETGLLWIAPRLREVLRPLFVTWGQANWAGSARIYEDYGTRDKARILTLESALDFHAVVGAATKRARTLALRKHLLAGVEASKHLIWRSRFAVDELVPLVAIGARQGSVAALGAELFRAHGFVVRSFGGERDHLRVSPNFANTPAELDAFIERLEALLG